MILNMHAPARQAFTIVELLIVIVVIGILAAITIVSYNGIQKRADDAAYLTAIKNARSAITAYYYQEGKYPFNRTVCLGEGYIDRTGDGRPDCRWNSGNITVDNEFNAELAKVATYSAKIKGNVFDYGTGRVEGLYFMNDLAATLDGVTQQNWIVYGVDGKTCPIGPTPTFSTYPQFTSKSNNTVTENWGTGGLCFIPLP